eukprot:Opistho-2@34451
MSPSDASKSPIYGEIEPTLFATPAECQNTPNHSATLPITSVVQLTQETASKMFSHVYVKVGETTHRVVRTVSSPLDADGYRTLLRDLLEVHHHGTSIVDSSESAELQHISANPQESTGARRPTQPTVAWNLNSFILFANEYRRVLRECLANHTPVHNGVLSALLSNLWKVMPQSRKEEFKKQATDLRRIGVKARPKAVFRLPTTDNTSKSGARAIRGTGGAGILMATTSPALLGRLRASKVVTAPPVNSESNAAEFTSERRGSGVADVGDSGRPEQCSKSTADGVAGFTADMPAAGGVAAAAMSSPTPDVLRTRFGGALAGIGGNFDVDLRFSFSGPGPQTNSTGIDGPALSRHATGNRFQENAKGMSRSGGKIQNNKRVKKSSSARILTAELAEKKARKIDTCDNPAYPPGEKHGGLPAAQVRQSTAPAAGNGAAHSEQFWMLWDSPDPAVGQLESNVEDSRASKTRRSSDCRNFARGSGTSAPVQSTPDPFSDMHIWQPTSLLMASARSSTDQPHSAAHYRDLSAAAVAPPTVVAGNGAADSERPPAATRRLSFSVTNMAECNSTFYPEVLRMYSREEGVSGTLAQFTNADGVVQAYWTMQVVQVSRPGSVANPTT